MTLKISGISSATDNSYKAQSLNSHQSLANGPQFMPTDSLPKISIVTPSYNQGEFIEATIDSILSQNYPNLEYIIIDGGSTDRSVEVIKKYAKHLHYWCTEPDEGHYDAVNKGFAHSTGTIMGWLNSDDMYYPWTLLTVGSAMSQQNSVEWLSTLRPGFWDYHGFCRGFISVGGYSKEAFLDGRYEPWGKHTIGHIQQESTFWRRSLWDRSGGYVSTELKLASDFDLWTRFYEAGELVGIDSPLGGFRHQSNQRSRNQQNYSDELNRSLDRLRKALKWKPNYMRSFISKYKIAKVPKCRNNILSKFGYTGRRIVRSLADTPNGQWILEYYNFL